MCGKTARTVRREEGSGHKLILPTPIMSNTNREIHQKRERMDGWPTCSPRQSFAHGFLTPDPLASGLVGAPTFPRMYETRLYPPAQTAALLEAIEPQRITALAF